MKKLVVALLSLMACLLLLVACNNSTNSGTPTIPDEPTVKIYTVNVDYVYRDTVVYKLTDTKKEGEAHNYAKYDENIPNGYVKNDAKNSYFEDDYPKGSFGYEQGVLSCIYEIKPKTPYSTNYDEVVDLGQDEVNSNTLREIEDININLDNYDTIILEL